VEALSSMVVEHTRDYGVVQSNAKELQLWHPIYEQIDPQKQTRSE